MKGFIGWIILVIVAIVLVLLVLGFTLGDIINTIIDAGVDVAEKGYHLAKNTTINVTIG